MIPLQQIALRLIIATAFGSLIGLERARLERGAGLRTHMLVCLASSLMMIVSAYGFSDILRSQNVTLDPSRIAAQVISGIGFIGAGTIIFHRQEVIKGLTTAAAMWAAAGIGLATGAGMFLAALIATALTLIVLIVFHPVSRQFSSRYHLIELKLTFQNEKSLQDIEKVLTKTYSFTLKQISIDYNSEEQTTHVLAIMRYGKKKSFAPLVAELQQIVGISQISIKE